MHVFPFYRLGNILIVPVSYTYSRLKIAVTKDRAITWQGNGTVRVKARLVLELLRGSVISLSNLFEQNRKRAAEPHHRLQIEEIQNNLIPNVDGPLNDDVPNDNVSSEALKCDKLESDPPTVPPGDNSITVGDRCDGDVKMHGIGDGQVTSGGEIIEMKLEQQELVRLQEKVDAATSTSDLVQISALTGSDSTNHLVQSSVLIRADAGTQTDTQLENQGEDVINSVEEVPIKAKLSDLSVVTSNQPEKPRLRRSSRIAAQKTNKDEETMLLTKGSLKKEKLSLKFPSTKCKSSPSLSKSSKLLGKPVAKVPPSESEKPGIDDLPKCSKTDDKNPENSPKVAAENPTTICSKQMCLTCPALADGSCSTEGLIYLITCLVDRCNATYIGETHRKISERFSEHWRTCTNPHFESYKMRAMGIHYATVHPGAKPELKLEILETIRSQKKRRERESQLIIERKPSLNIKIN